MITVDSAVHNLLKPLTTQYGFKKKRNVYIRLVNDMVQVFNLKKMYGCKCSIEFDSFPLCAGNTVFFGTHDIDMFEEIKYFEKQDKRFIYFKDDESSIYRVAEELFNVAKKYLFPYFESTDNSKSHFDTWVNPKTNLYMRRYDDSPNADDALESFCSWNYQLHAIALKNHNYSFAIKHIICKIDSYEETFQKYDFDPESDNGKWDIEIYHKYVTLKEWVENEDNAKIDAFVAENEDISLQALKVKYRI